MSGAREGPPGWAPAFVRAAARRGKGSEADLLSGAAWSDLLDGLRRAGELIRSERAPRAALDRTAGYQHLLALLALGIDEALRPADPWAPRIAPGAVDSVLKWGMDCPDALYLGASLRGDCAYRIRGSRGSARYVGVQVMRGMETFSNRVADDAAVDLTLSVEERGRDWMPIPEGGSSLVVRQFFYDWETEEPARLVIERVAGESREYPPLDPAAVGRRLVALGEFVEASLEFWMQMQEGLVARGPNGFAEPSARTDIGGAEENLTIWGAWALQENEALVVELEPPPGALYWSIALGNVWWESIDYANHQSSLNGHQAVAGGDGRFRAVVAHRDPGVANWLDTAGHSQGPMIIRCVLAPAAPVPSTSVVPFDELDGLLPSDTARVTPAQRRTAVDRRRAGVARRFCR